MLDALRDLVRNIALIIIITTFLELLLPNTNMRRYTQLVLGLFVVAVIINPVLAFLHKPVDMDFAAVQPANESAQLDTIISDGENLSRKNQEAVFLEYKAKLEKQMAVMVQLLPGVESAEVAVTLQENPQSEGTPGSIREVTVKADLAADSGVSPPGSAGSGVGPIRVEINGVDKTDGEEIGARPKDGVEEKIVSVICDFYGLERDQLKIEIT